MGGMPQMPDLYAVYKPNTGWSSGSAWPRFSLKNFKIWNTVGKLNAHFAMVATIHISRSRDVVDKNDRDGRGKFIPEDWRVVNLTSKETWSARDFYVSRGGGND